MLISHRQILIVALVIGYYHSDINVEAQVSLYIPGFEPQPVSADALGVGSDGRTTWALHQGKVTDSLGSSQFIGTATLVEGPGYASLTYANEAAQFTIDQICLLSGDFALCTIAAQGSTNIQTEFVSSIPVQTSSISPPGVETTRPPAQTSPGISGSQATPMPSVTNQPPPSPSLPSSGHMTVHYSLSYYIIIATLTSLHAFAIS